MTILDGKMTIAFYIPHIISINASKLELSVFFVVVDVDVIFFLSMNLF